MENPFRSAFAEERSSVSEPTSKVGQEMDLVNRTYYGVVPSRYQDEFDLAVYSAISELQVKFLSRCVIPNENVLVETEIPDTSAPEVATTSAPDEVSEAASDTISVSHQDSDTKTAIEQFLSDAQLDEISMRDDYLQLCDTVKNFIGKLSIKMTAFQFCRLIHDELLVPYANHRMPFYPAQTEKQELDDKYIEMNVNVYLTEYNEKYGMLSGLGCSSTNGSERRKALPKKKRSTRRSVFSKQGSKTRR